MLHLLELPEWQPAICLSDRFDIHALVDEEDHQWARQWLWGYKYAAGVKCSKDKLYARRATRIGGIYTNVWLHREICRRAHGEAPSAKHMADHINGDSLDCRRLNMRWATPAENSKNRFGQLAKELGVLV